MTPPPLRDTYWVVEGRLLAGPHPGPYDDERARDRVGILLDAGIRHFIDLTQRDEVPTYEQVLQEEAAARGLRVDYRRAPVIDRSIPAKEDLAEVLATIDRALAAREPVYVHCWGGIGRTGTIIGCWLAQNGHTGDAALEQLAALRASCHGGTWRSPETEEQREMVRTWARKA